MVERVLKRNIPYYTELDPLKISTYGRNIQNLIQYAKEIQDPDRRQQIVEYIIELMIEVQKNGENIKSKDLKQRLWNHLMEIADYELDVKIPEGVTIIKEDLRVAHDPLPYPQQRYRFRQYGHFVLKLIDKAVQIEDENLRKNFAVLIGSYMKLARVNWNKESEISNDSIRADLIKMSEGRLIIPQDADLDMLINAPLKRQTKVLKALEVQKQKQTKKKKKKRKKKRSH